DVFLGHHSHVFHDIEIYKGKLIVYGLGDFVFDLLWDKRLRVSAIIEIDFCNEGPASVRVHPVYIKDDSYPALIPPGLCRKYLCPDVVIGDGGFVELDVT